METKTIGDISNKKDLIAINLETYRKRLKDQGADMNVGQYGSESEYSLNSLVGGIKNILTDISFLVNSHNVFVKLSTFTERSAIYSYLDSLNMYIENSNHANIATQLDLLKVSLRCYNLRSDKDRYLEFSNEIDKLRKVAIQLEDEIRIVKENVTLSDTTYKQITAIKEQFDQQLIELEANKNNFISKVDSFTNEFESFQTLAKKATDNEALISQKLENVKESEAAFDEFIAEIDKREKQLVSQKEQTDKYDSALIKYTEEHNLKLSEAQTLIKKALIALQYSTAEGISAAFQAQYDLANKPESKKYWIWGAVSFMVITIGLGLWIVGGWGIESADKTYSLIGRLTMIPFTLLGALFCANQYVRQKNIIEDYAYKSVLSKSIVAFSEELREKDQERYAEYISTVLKEIHQDPLRRRGKEKDEVSLKDSAGIVDKIIELAKAISK